MIDKKENHARTELLIGADGVMKLQNSNVIVFGAGGVGGAVIEALARSGIGRIAVVDNDVVSESNLNRQFIALYSTLGQYKTETARNRILDINPECKVDIFNVFVTPQNVDENIFNLTEYDFVIDAIDNVSAKIALAVYCEKYKIKLISCMGTGNKLNPLLFRICDVYETSVCPLARVMRYELKKRGVKSLQVLYSQEKPIVSQNNKPCEKSVPGSVPFVPPVAGLVIAGEVIKELIK